MGREGTGEFAVAGGGVRSGGRVRSWATRGMGSRGFGGGKMVAVLRLFLRVLAAALALLTLVLVVAWVESYWHQRGLEVTRLDVTTGLRSTRHWYVISDCGGVLAIRSVDEIYTSLPQKYYPHSLPRSRSWSWDWRRYPSAGYPGDMIRSATATGERGVWVWHGFALYSRLFQDNLYAIPSETRVTQVVFPYWAAALLTGVFPLAWLWRTRRHIPPGHCHTCGYDMRATPTRCPECGAAAGGDGGGHGGGGGKPCL